MRIMGLDFGDKTVGVALSDPLFLNARPKEIIFRERPTKLRQTLARIEAIIEEEEVSEIVLGLPLNLDGTEGERVEKTREFAEMLERRTGMPITFHDERLTTVEADAQERYKTGRQKKTCGYDSCNDHFAGLFR